ncbi:MAG TPA: SpoIIE family protein phosphatase [Acidobacteriota bacterium]|nr:SpoIIE family protein phosphatase [Acidobacteriota bacterium]
MVAAVCLPMPSVYGQSPIQITADRFGGGNVVDLQSVPWRYHPGDQPEWAQIECDDGHWELISNTHFLSDHLPSSGWQGSGWFRLTVNVEPDVVHLPLNVTLQQLGASEVYLNGKLIQRFGQVGTSSISEQPFNPGLVPFGFVFNRSGPNLIAVRLSNQAMADMRSGWGRWLSRTGYGAGFRMQLRDAGQSQIEQEQDFTSNASLSLGTAGVFAAFGILHLLLFVFYPKQRANLYFSLYALGVAWIVLAFFWIATGHQGAIGTAGLFFTVWFGIDLTNVAILAFLYAAVSQPIPRYFWWVLTAWGVLLLSGIPFPNSQAGLWLYTGLSFFTAVESLRIVGKALIQKLDGGWIIAIAMVLVALNPLKEALVNAGLLEVPPMVDRVHGLTFGVIVSISIYLARTFAQTNQSLEQQLEQVKVLSEQQLESERQQAELRIQHEQEKARLAKIEAENERRAQELEEARQLQLLMLPKSVPQLKNLEIAVFMRPATEVGGDYYDFQVSADGTLTVAVGDATGHGLKAGTMVTAAKSLFTNLAHEEDLEYIFKQSSRVLKEMNLRSLYMAMGMLKIKGWQATVCLAGMPPILHYRADSQTVEEILVEGMPLGSPVRFPYQQQELTLGPGDVVVLMSDGFPERFNAEDDIFGYPKVEEVFAALVHQSPDEIIRQLVKAGDDWAGDHPQDDDITFVVLKMKAAG